MLAHGLRQAAFAGETNVRKAKDRMGRIRRIVSGVFVLRVSLGVSGCGSEDSPVAPRADLRTDVSVEPGDVVSGQRPRMDITFVATTARTVEVEFLGAGFRVFAASGETVIENISIGAANFDTLTDEVADDLLNKSYDLQEDKLDIEKKYYEKVKDQLGAKQAGKFMQIINRLNMLIDIQVAAELPLIPVDATTK